MFVQLWVVIVSVFVFTNSCSPIYKATHEVYKGREIERYEDYQQKTERTKCTTEQREEKERGSLKLYG